MPVAEGLDLDAATEVGFYTPLYGGATAYIGHGGYHWLAEPIPGGGGMGSYPGPGTTEAIGLYVHRMDPTGYSVAFPVTLPIWFDWVDDLSGFTLGGPDFLCSWEHLIYRGAWQCGVHTGGGDISAAFASDGTNLWLGVVTRSEEPYPYYHSRYGFPYMSPETLEALSASGGYYAYQGSFPFCGGAGPGSWDDLGVTLSQRWHPASLFMFVWNGSAFEPIDRVQGLFETEHLESSTLDAGGRVGAVELAASPAEPGVCHALWGECGQYGRRIISPPDGTAWPYRGTRLVYSKWSTSAKLIDHELMRYDIQDVTPDPPPDLPAMPWWTFAANCRAIDLGGSYSIYPFRGLTDHIAYTPIYAIRNDHGSPIIFLSKYLIWPQDAGNPDGEGATTAGSEPAIRAWLPDGTELQVLTSDLLPTAAENQYGGGVVGGATPDRMMADHGSSFGLIVGRVGVLSLSSRYVDATLAGQAVYLLSAWWGVLRLGAIHADGEGIYRIPCDGSAPFSLLDGDRNLAILPNVNHQQTGGSSPPAGLPYVPINDFFSNAKSVWVPPTRLGFGGGVILQLDRVCEQDWEHWQLFHNDADFDPASRPFYDAAAGKFYWAEYLSSVAVATIIREICGATGLHLWHRSPDHR